MKNLLEKLVGNLDVSQLKYMQNHFQGKNLNLCAVKVSTLTNI